MQDYGYKDLTQDGLSYSDNNAQNTDSQCTLHTHTLHLEDLAEFLRYGKELLLVSSE